MRTLSLSLLLLPIGALAQCFGTFQYPSNTIVADESGTATFISTCNWAGDYALVSLTAGHTYRFTSSEATEHITVSDALNSGVLAFGTQPVVVTALTTQVHFVHYHTDPACGVENICRTTEVVRILCLANTTSCGGSDEAIVDITFGGIQNPSGGCGTQGYSDFTAGPSTSLYPGLSEAITVVNANPFPGDQVHVFLDWDRDFDLGDPGETYVLNTSNYITFNGSITPPPGTVPGPVRMRVRLAYTGAVPACGNTAYGEVEDYTVYVMGNSNGPFTGGNGRGDGSVIFSPAPIVSNIFSGGNGRGDMAKLFSPTPIASNIFNGGNGRGDVARVFSPTPIASNIFNGGNGRGDMAKLFSPTPIASNIFNGGNGRGDVARVFSPTPIASNIFNGGNGRGDVARLFAPTPIVSNIFSGGNGRGDVAITFTEQPPEHIVLALRAVLEGPYNNATGQMSDALRAAGHVPTVEPYTALGYAHSGGGGAESVPPSVLTTTGKDAIVDWVVVELRDAVTPTTVLASRDALIQRDGDVVSTDGVSPLTFFATPGTYHVAIRHRNHLGAMTGTTTTLGLSSTPLDLSVAATATYGTAARKSIGGSYPAEVLWAGDVTFNGQIKYTGGSNDRDPLLNAIGGVVPTATVNGYQQADVNMNGQVKYTGSNNDRDPILQNIGGVVPTSTRNAQFP